MFSNKYSIYILWHSEKKRGQLIQVFKLLHNHYDADYHNFFHRVHYNVTRGNNLKLNTVRARLSLRSRFFTVCIVRAWNGLPNDILNTTILN